MREKFYPRLYLRGNAEKLKNHIRMRWSRLSEEEIDQVETNREEFFAIVQRKYGIPAYETEQKILQWERENASVAA